MNEIAQISLPTATVLGIQLESVEAVVVAWDPALEPLSQTTDRTLAMIDLQ